MVIRGVRHTEPSNIIYVALPVDLRVTPASATHEPPTAPPTTRPCSNLGSFAKPAPPHVTELALNAGMLRG